MKELVIKDIDDQGPRAIDMKEKLPKSKTEYQLFETMNGLGYP